MTVHLLSSQLSSFVHFLFILGSLDDSVYARIPGYIFRILQLRNDRPFDITQHLLCLFVKVRVRGLDEISSLLTDHVHNVLDTAIGDKRED